MRTLALLAAAIGLSGCIAVPVYEPAGVYVAPPTVVVRPHFSGHHGSYGHDGRWRRRWQ